MAELRRARVEDVADVVAIDPGNLGCPEQIAALLRKGVCLAAVEHGRVVGFLAIKPGHFYGRDFVDLLYVAPSQRRRGVGRALLRAALKTASTSRMFVSTNESNTAMQNLLRDEGWNHSGVLTGLDADDPEHVFFRDADRAGGT